MFALCRPWPRPRWHAGSTETVAGLVSISECSDTSIRLFGRIALIRDSSLNAGLFVPTRHCRRAAVARLASVVETHRSPTTATAIQPLSCRGGADSRILGKGEVFDGELSLKAPYAQVPVGSRTGSGSGPQNELALSPVGAKREPLKFGVDHRRRVYLSVLHRADVPRNRWKAANQGKDDEPCHGDHAGACRQPQQPDQTGRDHGSTTFRNSQPKVRLAIASDSARLRHWPST